MPDRRRLLPATVWLIALAMLGLELCQVAAEAGVAPRLARRWVVTSVLGFFDTSFEAARRGTIHAQVLWSLVTHPFVHLNGLHLALNLAPLLGFAHVITRLAGLGVFLALFFGSAVAGALTLGLVSQVAAPMIGASGGVAGLVGAVAVWHRRPLVWAAILGLVLLDQVVGGGPLGVVAWEAHLGGLIAGSALALALPRTAAAPR